MRCIWMLLAAAAVVPATARADDWPQWLGPHRDSVWRESGIVSRFPEKGLEIQWRVPVELGYSGPAVSGGKVYVMDYRLREGEVTNNPGGAVELKGDERLLCFDARTGRRLWEYVYDRPYKLSYPGGPRCTPTVDRDRVYALGAEGDLSCLEAATGRVVWKKNLAEAYHTEAPFWGFAAHPLVAGELLYCVVGGEGSVAVALDKATGREVWRALSAESAGYCPPTMITFGGRQQLLIWHPEALNALDPPTGTLLWSVPLKPAYGMSITAPRQAGEHLFVSGIGNTAVLLKLKADPPGAEVVWRGDTKSAVYCANSTPLLEGEMIFGNDCQVGTLRGVRLSDGKRLWETFQPTTGGKRRASHGTVFIVKHDDRFFLFSETGDLILARLSADGYQEISRFHVVDPTNEAFSRDVVWSHPAFADRAAFVRNDKELVRVNLAVERGPSHE